MNLFEDEDKVFNDAAKRVEEIQKGGSLDFEDYLFLVKEYGKLLKQLRQSIHFADRISNGLYKNNLNLDDKVHFDALTGIYNRRFMEDNLNGILKSLSLHNRVLSVMMLDIDFFKRYNDTYGHSMGDECLKAVARALSDTARENDCVIRYGGEEFVIILPNTDEVGAGIIAARILKNIRSLGIPHINSDAAGYVTISIGATTAEVKQHNQYMSYIERADEALYISKDSGRDRYTHLRFKDDEGDIGNEV